MSMVCGLDLHCQQITFDAEETVSGRCGGATPTSPHPDSAPRAA